MPLNNGSVFNALIRTHHITSRKKIAKLKHAADIHSCVVILHSGKCPGIMYCEGSDDGVKSWVNVVQGLRYKDYQLVARPASADIQAADSAYGKVTEASSVKDFGDHMKARGVFEWWRKAMGYT